MLAARERRCTGAVDALTLPPWRWPSLALALALEAKTSSSLCPCLSSLGPCLSFSSNISLYLALDYYGILVSVHYWHMIVAFNRDLLLAFSIGIISLVLP